MKKIIFALLSVVLVYSCAGGAGKKKGNALNYFDRNVSEYSTGADGIDQKVVFNRGTKEYQVFTKATMFDGDWELEDNGHYEESFDNDNIVTCELDNAKLKREDNERLGTIFRVKIFLKSRTASFISIAGESGASDITD